MTRSLRRILVPLDGSPLAERALPVAVSLARKAHTSIELVGVQPFIVEYTGDAVMAGGVIERAAARQLERYLEQTASHIRHNSGVSVSCQILHGEPATRIAALAKARRAGLIVMTTHGRGGLARLWLGSVADQLLRVTRTPVLLLHPQDAAAQPLSPALVALDTDLEGLVLDRAIAFAGLVSGTRFALVHVIEPPPPVYSELAALPAALDPELVKEAEDRARKPLDVLAGGMRERGLDVTTHVPVSGQVGHEVCHLAEQLDTGLIVVGTHGRRGTMRLLLGSVADKVVRGARRPVLVIPMAGGKRKADSRERMAKIRRRKIVYAS